MIKKKEIIDKAINPRDTLKLYGYEKYFNNFIKLYKNGNLPRSVLLSGLSGSGKSTFFYHFINYIFSKNESHSYNLNKNEINKNNKSFNLIQNFVHPNFYLLEENEVQGLIKVNQVRELLKFTNKSAFRDNLKFVLINNAESLNLNSSNALLKNLEEPPENTFFFIIHNNFTTLSETIKSRCIQFNIHFNTTEKKNILNQISKNYDLTYSDNLLNKFVSHESPGNILRYLINLNLDKKNIMPDLLSTILYFTKKMRDKKDADLINFIKILIENFYYDLSIKNSNYINNYTINKNKIIKMIHEMKIYNLDKKNLLIAVDNILINEF